MEGHELSHTYAEPSAEETSEKLFQKRRCCFFFPSSGGVSLKWWRKVRTEKLKEGSVWAKGINALKKLREWSEIVAGPRWKTFIRRFNRNKSGTQGKFQYDPLSYALNFDEGNNGEEDECGLRDFSTRYASIPASARGASIDLGKDGSNFV